MSARQSARTLLTFRSSGRSANRASITYEDLIFEWRIDLDECRLA
jgi:hypothetical protein